MKIWFKDWSQSIQVRTQKAELDTNIKERLLKRAVILINCTPNLIETSLKGKNLLPEGANSFL